MSNRTLAVTPEIHDYLVNAVGRETELMAKLRAETAKLPSARMQIAPEQGQFMGLLVELMGARRAIEIGTFTGYSALAVASALPSDGHLLACDVNAEWTAIGRRYWQEAGLGSKIELSLRPALETLDELLEGGRAGAFDFAFIDADKENYLAYYERCVLLLRVGGLIAVDNTLWHGDVADSSKNDPETRAIRQLNRRVAQDERVSMSLVPIGDGLLLARKR
jgi:predicted O-methyltransferase YrrM